MNNPARFQWQSFYRSWPLHGWIGLTLAAAFWILNWSLTGLRTHRGFFPLWLVYLGYLPFSLALFALHHLLSGLPSRCGTGNYIHLQ